MFKNVISNLIYPEICVFCEEYVSEEIIEKQQFKICQNCCENLENKFDNYCNKCYLPVGKEHNAPDCTSCRNRSVHYDSLYFINEYKTYVGELIIQFKYGKDRFLALCLSELLYKRFINFNRRIDIIIPVPMFWFKKMMRGFNQSELIAYELSVYLEKPMKINILKRKVVGKNQAGRSRTYRNKNVKGLYYISKNLDNKNVLLVDDVVTTGSTLSECARLLKENGANEVIGASLAGVQRIR